MRNMAIVGTAAMIAALAGSSPAHQTCGPCADDVVAYELKDTEPRVVALESTRAPGSDTIHGQSDGQCPRRRRTRARKSLSW
jgi:hypothetical protein